MITKTVCEAKQAHLHQLLLGLKQGLLESRFYSARSFACLPEHLSVGMGWYFSRTTPGKPSSTTMLELTCVSGLRGSAGGCVTTWKEKPIAFNYGLLWLNYELLWGMGASCLGHLAF